MELPSRDFRLLLSGCQLDEVRDEHVRKLGRQEMRRRATERERNCFAEDQGLMRRLAAYAGMALAAGVVMNDTDAMAVPVVWNIPDLTISQSTANPGDPNGGIWFDFETGTAQTSNFGGADFRLIRGGPISPPPSSATLPYIALGMGLDPGNLFFLESARSSRLKFVPPHRS